jgi:hypothetical protein
VIDAGDAHGAMRMGGDAEDPMGRTDLTVTPVTPHLHIACVAIYCLVPEHFFILTAYDKDEIW